VSSFFVLGYSSDSMLLLQFVRALMWLKIMRTHIWWMLHRWWFTPWWPPLSNTAFPPCIAQKPCSCPCGVRSDVGGQRAEGGHCPVSPDRQEQSENTSADSAWM